MVSADARGASSSAEISLTRSARRYDAVIDAIEPPRFEGTQPKFWVTFPEYGNSVCRISPTRAIPL